MQDSKNQIIRSMKSYEVGGTSEDACMEEYTDIDGKKKKRRKKGCGHARAQQYNKRQQGKAKRKEVLGKVAGGLGAAAAATGAYLTNIFGVKDALNKNKVGGTVKKRSGGPVSKTRTTTKRK
jgi:hypothetical protein